LVSTAGVGTIAAGVAKCYADKIIILGSLTEERGLLNSAQLSLQETLGIWVN